MHGPFRHREPIQESYTESWPKSFFFYCLFYLFFFYWRQSSKPVRTGQHYIQKKSEGISRKASETTDAPLTKLCTLKASGLQIMGNQAGDVFLVFDYEDEQAETHHQSLHPLAVRKIQREGA